MVILGQAYREGKTQDQEQGQIPGAGAGSHEQSFCPCYLPLVRATYQRVLRDILPVLCYG